MIKLDNNIAQDIIDFCLTDTDAEWEYGYDESHGENNIINRGRKLLLTSKTPFADAIVQLEQQYLTGIGLPGNAIVPTNEDDVLPHFFSCLFKDTRKSMGIQRHTDPRKDGWPHMRINYMIQAPESGGEPIINKRILTVDSHEAWNCWASEHIHSALPISGNTMRVSVSLGFYVNPDYVQQVKDRIGNVVKVVVNE